MENEVRAKRPVMGAVAVAVFAAVCLYVVYAAGTNATDEARFWPARTEGEIRRSSFESVKRVALPLKRAVDVCVDTAGTIYAAGDRKILSFDPVSFRLKRCILTDADVTCVAVDSAGNVYAGRRGGVDRFRRDGKKDDAFELTGPATAMPVGIVALAVTEERVFAADPFRKAVSVFDGSGRFMLAIEKGDWGSFIVPSPCMDVKIDRDGFLHATNPGRLRVEKFTFDGRHLGSWGEAGPGAGQFTGCCNPSGIAVTEELEFVTVEKGDPRIGRYSPAGAFVEYVGGSELLSAGSVPRVCVDGDGRIVVLDPGGPSLIVIRR